MALNLTNIIVTFLQQNPEQRFTASEIALWILKTYPKECREKQKHSKAKVVPLDNEKALLQQIVAEIGSLRPRLQKRYPEIKVTEGRPKKFYFTHATDDEEIILAERPKASASAKSKGSYLNEHDLYSVLSQFLWSELSIYNMRIDEKRSRNSHGTKGNKWLHPDLVGMEDLSSDWHREVKDCAQQYADKKTKLWSFEVKILINRSNVRETFFQAVSNSSWVNFGYLVAHGIEGAGTLKELRMLASLHCIGLIQLNVDEHSDSQILIPAQERADVNWDTANRLTEENKDFLAYIKLIRKFYQTGETRKSEWGMRSVFD